MSQTNWPSITCSLDTKKHQRTEWRAFYVFVETSDLVRARFPCSLHARFHASRALRSAQVEPQPISDHLWRVSRLPGVRKPAGHYWCCTVPEIARRKRRETDEAMTMMATNEFEENADDVWWWRGRWRRRQQWWWQCSRKAKIKT